MRLISAAGADKAFVHSPTTAGPSLGCARESGIHVLRSRRKERWRGRVNERASESEKDAKRKGGRRSERDRMTGVVEGRREREDEKKRDRENGYPGEDWGEGEGRKGKEHEGSVPRFIVLLRSL